MAASTPRARSEKARRSEFACRWPRRKTGTSAQAVTDHTGIRPPRGSAPSLAAERDVDYPGHASPPGGSRMPLLLAALLCAADPCPAESYLYQPSFCMDHELRCPPRPYCPQPGDIFL